MKNFRNYLLRFISLLFISNGIFYQNYVFSDQLTIRSLFFNEDGTIQKVRPTLWGIGGTNALQTIQIDRYNKISSKAAVVVFIDTLNKFSSRKTEPDKGNTWII